MLDMNYTDEEVKKALEAVEKRNEYQRKWRAANKDKMNEYAKKWRAKNPHKVKEYNEKKRQREAIAKAGLKGDLPLNSTPDLEKRLTAVEQKLDTLIQLLTDITARNKQARKWI